MSTESARNVELSRDTVAAFQSLARPLPSGGTLHHRLLTPPPGAGPWPVVLFLHGAGERGADNVAQLRYFPERMADPARRAEHPCYLIAPQCPDEMKWIDVPWGAAVPSPPPAVNEPLAAVLAVLDEVLARPDVDRARVYVTGLSMGGYGAWDLATRHPEKFAALLAVCGGGDVTQASRLKDLPIWAFHGALDDAVPVERSREMIAAIRAAGGNPRYTEWPEVDHHSWIPAYADSSGAIDWMFQQRRVPTLDN